MARRSSYRSRSGRFTVTEEEIAEYMVKKAQKKAVSVAKKLKSRTVSGYSNDSNPFGDSNLNEKFVWRKKIERNVLEGGLPLDEFSVKSEKKRQRERMVEIEKAKRRRETVAIQKVRHEEEMGLLVRERDRAAFQEWENKEVEFLRDQRKIRSEIRIREGRPKPIDLLIQHISDPLMVFSDLSVEEIEELHSDIKMSLDLDRAKPNLTEVRYWEALLVVCEWKLSKAKKSIDFEESGFHSSIEGDVMRFLEGKSYSELESFQSQIGSNMQSGTAMVVEYWEAVLKRLHVFKANAFLNENHSKKPGISKSEDENFEENDAVIVSKNEINLDEYSLQKPKYFNHVHVGYEWNKYNQIHYDHDNPPPKTVKGYKFDIFYPDLVDKSSTPTYSLEKDEDSTETCIIRFHAGPPYEDLAFRIVNEKWERSKKKGFKCNFENGVLRLYFNFVRNRYRR